jgi:hypothetical protein
MSKKRSDYFVSSHGRTREKQKEKLGESNFVQI